MRPEDLWSTSDNFLCGQETFSQLTSIFRVAGRPSVNYHQFPFCREPFHQLSSTFNVVKKPSDNFRQLSMQPGDLLSTSVNFLCSLETFLHVLFTFCAAGRPSDNIHQLSVRPGDLPPTSIKFPCGRKTSVNFRLLSVWPGDLPSIYVNLLCGREIFCQLLSTFCTGWRPSVNFCQLNMQSEKLPSTLRVARRLPSTSFNFPCGRESFRQLPSTFRAAGRPSENFHQISEQLGYLPSTFYAAGRRKASVKVDKRLRKVNRPHKS